MTENVAIVSSLMRSFEEQDVEKTLSFFNKDAVWTNIPMKTPAVGIDAIRKALGSFGFTPQAVKFVIHNTAESPDTDVVMNERTDRFKTEKGWLAIRVMGVFELKNGKIQEWRDYFDLAELQRQLS